MIAGGQLEAFGHRLSVVREANAGSPSRRIDPEDTQQPHPWLSCQRLPAPGGGQLEANGTTKSS
jgi:hypothetical protein